MAISPAQSKDIQARREACQSFIDDQRPLVIDRLHVDIAFKAGWEAHKAHLKGRK